LQAVLQELVANAVRHDSGPIHVRCRQHDGAWELQVSGSGPALPADELPHLAHAFYRGAQQRADGSGLGLTMVARFVTEMGGQWQLDTADGHGLIVTVRLPQAGADDV